jgi:hypothetical protein
MTRQQMLYVLAPQATVFAKHMKLFWLKIFPPLFKRSLDAEMGKRRAAADAKRDRRPAGGRRPEVTPPAGFG